MKQVTAVEWLIGEIENRNGIIDSETDDLVRGSMISYGYGDLYEKAKEMEKQQIIDAAESQCIWINSKERAENYYNKTFKSE
jgi:hypothetical protein